MRTTNMLITITLLLIHATKSCLPDKILDTLIDDEEYELFQGILGELDNLDLGEAPGLCHRRGCI